jgi:hypothetical protein
MSSHHGQPMNRRSRRTPKGAATSKGAPLPGRGRSRISHEDLVKETTRSSHETKPSKRKERKETSNKVSPKQNKREQTLRESKKRVKTTMQRRSLCSSLNTRHQAHRRSKNSRTLANKKKFLPLLKTSKRWRKSTGTSDLSKTRTSRSPLSASPLGRQMGASTTTTHQAHTPSTCSWSRTRTAPAASWA